MVFGRPKKEAKPDMRPEAVISELEWEIDDKSQQIVADARSLIRIGKPGYAFIGVNDKHMTRWKEPETNIILTFYWGEDEFTHYPKRMANVDLTEFNRINAAEKRRREATEKRPRGRKRGRSV